MKLYIEIEPNAFNDNGLVIVIYRSFLFFKFEMGRVTSTKQLELFLVHYARLHGKRIDAEHWLNPITNSSAAPQKGGE